MIPRAQCTVVLFTILSFLLFLPLLRWTEKSNISYQRKLKTQGYNRARPSNPNATVTWQGSVNVSDSGTGTSSERIAAGTPGPTPPSRCSPRTNIVFLKTHKCGSSTLQNVLLRHGERRGLDFVLPEKANYLGLSVFHRGNMLYYPVKKYNILCHHTRFSYKAISGVMFNDSLYITILRDPVTQFRSYFGYFQRAKLYRLPADRALELFLDKPDYYYGMRSGRRLPTKNPMLYDLGLRKEHLGDRARIEEKIGQLERELDLVLILEYFDESMVLLRHLMCWDYDDVAYFVLNARGRARAAPDQQLSGRIRRWNAGDVRLYRAFNRTLRRRVAAFGRSRMRAEVGALRERVRYLEGRCASPAGSSRLGRGERETCDRMTRRELPYTEHLRELQDTRYGMGR